jgi:hypothetical protein
LLEREKSLVQKYIKEFDWKSFFKVTKILEQKGAEKLSRNFAFPTRKQTFV